MLKGEVDGIKACISLFGNNYVPPFWSFVGELMYSDLLVASCMHIY